MTLRSWHPSSAWMKLSLVIAVTASVVLVLPSTQGAQKLEDDAAQPKGKTNIAPPVPKERTQFRALLLGNPNYFGTLPSTKLDPVVQIQSNTTFEEIGCVGYQPQLHRLEAVVYIKQPTGYGGGVCSGGTPEFVRFYADWNGDGDFDDAGEDQGIDSFTATDISGTQRLEYAVTRTIDPKEKFCHVENLPRVRAILSWNNPPPPNTPDFPPVWGNVVESRIQIDPLKLIILGDLFEVAKLKLPKDLEEAVDLKQVVPAPPPKELSVADLQGLYRGKDVPPHRFAFKEVQGLLTPPRPAEPVAAPALQFFPPDLKIDLGDLLDKLQQINGNTTYEQLDCVGLDPNQDALVGVLRVKLSSGYSGNLCSQGSREYVAFWIDYGDGTWAYAGTTSVNVHDLSTLPPEGVRYAVTLPVDLSAHRQPCSKGPRTANVRAILSWQSAPPPFNPDFVPPWGNRQETVIHIKPGPTATPGDYTPYLESVGSIPGCSIDQATGLATGERPFGGLISVTGFVPGPPDLGSLPLKYRVFVRQLPFGPRQPLTNTFGISVIQQTGGGLPVGFGITQSADADGFYIYREDPNPSGSGWRLVQNRLLAQWVTAQPMTGPWQIEIEVKSPSGTIFDAGTYECAADGSTRKYIRVLLDELPPTAALQITGFSRGGGPVQPATDCGTFQVGDVIHGTYEALDPDAHFGSFSMSVEPVARAHGATVNPQSKSYPIVSTAGETGTWTLNTAGMDPCGYVVRLNVSDRTIVNNDGPWRDEDFVGFCLEAAKK